MSPGAAGEQRGESQAARSPPPPLVRPLRRPGRGEWPGASRRSQALRSQPALCSRARNWGSIAARGGGAGARGARRAAIRGTAPSSSPAEQPPLEPRSHAEGPRPAALPGGERRGGGVAPGEVARALSPSPLPFPLGPPRPASGGESRAQRLCAWGSRGPATPRGARVSGVCGSLSSGRGGAAAKTRPRRRSRRVVGAPQLFRGRAEEAWKLSCSYFAPLHSHPWA